MSIFSRFFAEGKGKNEIVKPKKTVFEELGSSGTSIAGGLIDEDFNTDLTGTNGISVWDKMRLTDSQVWATLEAVKLPIQEARWYIEYEEDEEIKKFVEKQMFEYINWDRFIEEATSFLDFGFYYFEIIWGLRDGRIVWDSLAPRHPKAHGLWQTAEEEKGVTQFLPYSKEGYSHSPSIPMDKLVLFTHKREGDNYGGRSLLRSAYRNWKYKDVLYRIQGVSAERFGCGVPMVTGNGDFSKSEKDKIEEMLKNLTSNERAFLFNPDKNKFTLDILSLKGDAKASAIGDAIAHHNRQITMNVLAPFLDLGEGSGSFALSESQASFFMLSLQSIARYMCSVLNDKIKELVFKNFGEKEVYPKLQVSEIGSLDVQAMATALNSLASSGYIKVDTKLRQHIREVYKLPEEDEEEIKENMQKEEEQKKQQIEEMKQRQQTPNGEAPPQDDEEVKKKGQKFQEISRYHRPLMLSEEKVEFSEIQSYLNHAESKTTRELDVLIQEDFAKVIKKAMRIIKTKNYKALRNFEYNPSSSITKLVYEVCRTTCDFAIETAKGEFKKAKNATVETQKIRNDVEEYIQGLKNSVERKVRDRAKTLMKLSEEDEWEDEFYKELEKDRTAWERYVTGGLIISMFNTGRRAVFTKNDDQIISYVRSEILDERCCDMCASLDGRVFAKTDPFVNTDMIHDSCRGIWVAVLQDEMDVMPPPSPLPKIISDRFNLVGGVAIPNSFRQFKKGANLPIGKTSRAYEKIQDGVKVGNIEPTQI